jgi:membrane-associated phospholipid phosphatase
MQIELDIIKWFQSFANSFTDVLGELFTILGEQYVLVAVLAFIYFVYNKKTAESIAYSVFLSLCLNNTLKGIVKADRPFQVDNEILGKRAQTATGFSFPSGHTQAAAVFYTSLGKQFKSKKAWTFFIIIIFLVGLSRVYLGVHFPRDIVAAVILGVATAIFGSYLYEKYAYSLKSKMILFWVTALVFFPFLFIFYKPNFSDIKVYRDFYTGYALFLGFICAVYLENKYVDFDCSSPLKTRLIRFSIALLIFIIIQFGLKAILPSENIFFDMLRYFMVTFVTMGLYPLTFKKFKLL